MRTILDSTLFLLAACVSAAIGLGLHSGNAIAQKPAEEAADCGNPFQNAYGPYDYRTATSGQKTIVEVNHFTPRVEKLQGAVHGMFIGGEIDYTLRAFPNHPRALMAMIRLGQREKASKTRGAQYTVQCYVERAVSFRPDDTDALLIRGIYYSTQHDYARAVADFKKVLESLPNNPNAHYNLGLAYFELKDYDRALEHAKAAKALGFSFEGLDRKLKSVGRTVN